MCFINKRIGPKEINFVDLLLPYFWDFALENSFVLEKRITKKRKIKHICYYHSKFI